MDKILLMFRDRIIKDGVKECTDLLKEQKPESATYFFYQGSIFGFEKCENFASFKDFECEISCLYGIEKEILAKYFNCSEKEMDVAKYWEILGERTQIEFVYNELNVFGIFQRD